MRSMLALLCLLVAVGSAADKPTQGLRYPSLTPDGKQVVFGYRGDIWIKALDGKSHAVRLTLHEAQDTLPRVSPDGKQIAFSSRRNGSYDVFLTSVDGGVPKQITFHSASEAVCDWSPDGKRVLFISERDGGRMDLYEVSVDGGTPRRVTRDGGRDGAYSPDGKRVVYSRGSIGIYWDNYEGSANFDLYEIPVSGGTPRRLTATDGNERYPCYGKDGKTVYFVAEKDKVANFWSMPAAGGAAAQLTKYKGADVHRPNLNWDFKTVVFERIGKLYTTDLSKPAEKPALLSISIKSDVRNSGVETRTITGGGEQVHISTDGRQAAFTLRGNIWIMPASGGKGRQVTDGPYNDQWPRFSPDGTKIAYFSNRRGNEDIYLLDLRTKQTRPLTNHPKGDFFQNWSPDGRTLVFCSERSGNKDIWLLDIASGKTTQLTRNPSADDDPTFSPDGTQIAFDSGRGGSQAIYIMQRNGSGARRVTGGFGFFQVPDFSPDGKHIVYETFMAGSPNPGGLHVVAISGGPSMMISRDGQTACWSPIGDYIYFTSTRGPHNSGIFRVKAPTSVEAGERVPFIGTVQVDRRKELGDVFDQAWRALGNAFYDKKMHGVDWKALRKKYRNMAIDAENKAEFHNVVRQLLAELGASHLGIGGGGPSGSSVAPTVTQTGYLGGSFDEKPTEDGGRRIAEVMAGGAADKAGLRVGDVIVRIGNKKLKASTNLDKVLTGTVGKTVPVRFKPHSASGLGEERLATVKPMSLGGLRALLYKVFEAKCAKTVAEAMPKKEGKLVYVHLSQMNPQNLQKFMQGIQKWNTDKKVRGLVLDVRNNGGGNIHGQLIQALTARPLARVQMRNGPKTVQPAIYWEHPVVLLTNERSFSDAEVFPFMFREAGLGKIVGMPTAGGVIGTTNITLSDGSTFRLPRTGFWSMSGTNLEGLGVKPDYLVEMTPEDRLENRDPQLKKAIEVILEEVRARARKNQKKKKAGQKKKEEKKPAEKVKPEPAPKAEPEPEPEAEPEPQSPAVADEKNPLADARVGEWVRYRVVMPGAPQEAILKVTIEKIDAKSVHFRKDLEKGPQVPVPLPELVTRGEILKALGAMGEVLAHSSVDGEVKGRSARILRVLVKWPDGSQLQFSFTNAVPGYGLWKVEMGKQTIMEAIEWGQPKTPDVVTKKEEPAPAAAPETKPEPKPEHPLFNAKEGEWVKLKQVRPDGREFHIRMTVTEVTDDEITIEQVLLVGDREIKGPVMRRERKRELTPPNDMEATSYGKESITVNDKQFDCVTMMAEMPNGSSLKYYVCDKVPVNGLVRLERDGEVVVEIVEWGDDD